MYVCTNAINRICSNLLQIWYNYLYLWLVPDYFVICDRIGKF